MIPAFVAADVDVKRARRLLEEALHQRASIADRLRRADALVSELEGKAATLEMRALADDSDAVAAFDLIVRQKDAATIVAFETSQKLDDTKEAVSDARGRLLECAAIAFGRSIASLTDEQLATTTTTEGDALTATETAT